MSRLGISLILLALPLSACQCGAEEIAKPQSVSHADLGELPTDIPIPRSVYQNAFDTAQAEITAENVAERLQELEKTILRETDSLR